MLHMLTRHHAASLGPIGSKMTAYWNFTEITGTRIDSIGNTPATNFAESTPNTVLSGTGPRGGADLAVGIMTSVHYLIISPSAAGSIMDVPTGGGDHEIFGWAYFVTNSGTQAVFSRWNTLNATGLTYHLDVSGSHSRGINGGSGYVIATGDLPSTGSWHFIDMWRDSTDGKVRTQLDLGTVYVSSTASSPNANSQNVTAGNAGPANFLLNGYMSRFGWIKGNILTPTERATLYNGGPTGALDWADIVSGGL